MPNPRASRDQDARITRQKTRPRRSRDYARQDWDRETRPRRPAVSRDKTRSRHSKVRLETQTFETETTSPSSCYTQLHTIQKYMQASHRLNDMARLVPKCNPLRTASVKLHSSIKMSDMHKPAVNTSNTSCWPFTTVTTLVLHRQLFNEIG